MEFVEQKTVKLLAQCARQIGALLAECLCLQPDKRLVRALLAEIRLLLDEFEQAYLEEPDAGARDPD